MSQKGERHHRAKQKAREVGRHHGRSLSREDLEYEVGLSREEADRVYRYLKDIESQPEWWDYGPDDPGASGWSLPWNEENVVRVILGEPPRKTVHELSRGDQLRTEYGVLTISDLKPVHHGRVLVSFEGTDHQERFMGREAAKVVSTSKLKAKLLR